MRIKKGNPDGVSIIISDGRSPVQRHGARELSRYISAICGAVLPIYTAARKKLGPEILLGADPAGREPGAKRAGKEPDAYMVFGQCGDIYIDGSNGRGLLYGVYALLEHWGCRWYTPGCETAPRAESLSFEDGSVLADAPAFPYREIFYNDMFHGDFAAKCRLNGDHQRLHSEHGGKISYVPGYFVHSFSRLVPPEKYFDSHPEYFAEKDGVRHGDPYTQLCLTNPEVLKIAAAQALADLRAHPEAGIISISQNDGGFPCDCKDCRKIAEEEGSQSGPIIRFVNAVAEEIEREFPEVWVDTLAYDYSRKPPKRARPRKNVLIRLCTFECCFAHPLSECREISDAKAPHTDPIFRDFAGDIEKWAEISERLFIWDYVTDFEFYHNIHPNFAVLQPNLRFFSANKVKGVFPQGNGQSPAGEMAELRAWLLSRLLWNPDYDVKAGTEEFLAAYFGPAAPQMAEYLRLTGDALARSGYHLSLFDSPKAPFITEELLDFADAIFDRAEEKAAADPAVLKRVRKERLAPRFSRFFTRPPSEEKSAEIERYLDDARALGVLRFSEKWGLSNIRRLAQRGIWPPAAEDMEVIRD